MGRLMKLVAKSTPKSKPTSNAEPVIPDVYEHKAKDGSVTPYPGVTFNPPAPKRSFFLGLRKLDFWDDHGTATLAFQKETGAVVEGCTPERGAFIMKHLSDAIKLALKS